jgi:hypothetical protein
MNLIKTAVAMAALTLSQIASANLVTNGSFEDTSQAANTWNLYTSVSGWTTSPNIEIRNDVQGTAFDGVNFVELDTDANSAIFQNIATTIGNYYQISFAYSPRVFVGAASNPIEVYFGGNLLDTLTGNGSSVHVWQTPTYYAQATTTSSRLEFRAVGINDSLGGSLDAVVVNDVPLPGTLALLGLGLAGIVKRRRAA